MINYHLHKIHDRPKAIAANIVFLLVLVLPLTGCLAKQPQGIQQPAATNGNFYYVSKKGSTGTGKFYASGNKIIDPKGNKFIIKGVNDLFGIWDGQKVGQYGSLQYQYAQRDFAKMKGMGVNYLRVWTSKQIMTNATWQSQLDNGIYLAKQQGFVVEVTCACNWDTVQHNVSFVQYLANRYKADPYVWIEPVNEPDCYGSGPCNDWNFWHNEWSQYIQTIRGQGFRNPIIIQTPWWSSGLRKYGDPSVTIDTPGYTFSDTNLIYSVHEYPSNSDSWTVTDTQDQDRLWGNYAANHAVIVDEFGPQNTGGVYEGWIQGFLDYLANWVNKRNGSGAVAFLWFWLTADSMTGTNIGSFSNGPTLNQWGNDYKTRYLDKVVSTGGVSRTPKPTLQTPTVSFLIGNYSGT